MHQCVKEVVILLFLNEITLLLITAAADVGTVLQELASKGEGGREVRWGVFPLFIVYANMGKIPVVYRKSQGHSTSSHLTSLAGHLCLP